jgi:hypothetical protein
MLPPLLHSCILQHCRMCLLHECAASCQKSSGMLSWCTGSSFNSSSGMCCCLLVVWRPAVSRATSLHIKHKLTTF